MGTLILIYNLVNQHPGDFILNHWCSSLAFGLQQRWEGASVREGGWEATNPNEKTGKREGGTYRVGECGWEKGEWERRRGGALWDGVRKHERMDDKKRVSGKSNHWERRRREGERGGWEEKRGRLSVCVCCSLSNTWRRDTDFSIQTRLFPRRQQQTWGLWWVHWPCRPSRGGRLGVRIHTQTRTHSHRYICAPPHTNTQTLYVNRNRMYVCLFLTYTYTVNNITYKHALIKTFSNMFLPLKHIYSV